MQHAADFILPADYRVEFAVACHLVEVNGVFAQGVVTVLSTMGGDPLALAELLNGCFQGLFGNACVFEHLRGAVFNPQQRQQNMFQGDEFILKIFEVSIRLLQDLRGGARQVMTTAADTRVRLNDAVRCLFNIVEIDTQLLQHKRRHVLIHLKDTL